MAYKGNPAKCEKDRVRAILGDINPQAPIFSDSEIDYFLDESKNVPLAAAIKGCDHIIAALSARPDETVGSIQVKYSKMLENYRVLRAELRARFEDANPIEVKKKAVPVIFSGSLSHDQVQTRVSDPDVRKPYFTEEMFDSRESLTSSRLTSTNPLISRK